MLDEDKREIELKESRGRLKAVIPKADKNCLREKSFIRFNFN
jgi:hypothetical protein